MRILLAAVVLAITAPAMAAPQVSKVREADGTHSLSHEVTVAAPPAEVWEAISSAKGWAGWAVPIAWASEPDVIETSYDPAATPGSAGTIKQQIVARIPGRLLVFRTVKAPARFPDFDTFARVTSIFELAPVGQRQTRVRLTGVGYADTEAGRRLLGFFESGNTKSLEWLADRFVTGPADWSKRLAARGPAAK